MEKIYGFLIIGSLPIWLGLVFLIFWIAIPLIQGETIYERAFGSLFILIASVLSYWNGWINRGKVKNKSLGG